MKFQFIAVLVIFMFIFFIQPLLSFTTISGVVTGTLPSNTYYVIGDITVPDNSTLTLQPNTFFKFGPNVGMNVYGTLNATGLYNFEIVFTSDDDNTVGQILPTSDNNPNPGDWDGILFDGNGSNEGSCIMDYCYVFYGGSHTGSPLSNVQLNNCDIATIDNSGFAYSFHEGFRISYCSPQITNSQISSNQSHGLLLTNYADAAIENCSITLNSSGIYSSINCNPIITGNTIINNLSYPIRIHCNQVGNITGNSFSGNTDNYIYVDGGTIENDSFWEDQDIRYRIFDDIYVQGTDGTDNVTTLTIEDDSELEFESGKRLIIGDDSDPNLIGALTAIGSENNEILFTSALSPFAHGDWKGIRFNNYSDDSQCLLEYCIILYAGYGSAESINCSYSSPSFDNCQIWFSENAAVNCSNSSANFTNCSFTNINTIGIEIVDSSSPSFNSCTINFCDSYGIYVEDGCEPTISNSTISNNQSYGIWYNGVESNMVISNNFFDSNLDYPIWTKAPAVTNFTGNTFSNNVNEQIYIHGGIVTTDSFWEDQGIPYLIGQNTYIRGTAGADSVTTLTLQEGTQIQFNSSSLAVGHSTNPSEPGALIAIGTQTDPILFTSGANSPAPGDWGGISFHDYSDDSICTLEYCTIEYGGESSYRNLYLNKANPIINKVISRYTSDYGIYCSTSSSTLSNCEVYGNLDAGVYISGGNPIIDRMTTFNNLYGIEIHTAGTVTVTNTIAWDNSNLGIYLYNGTLDCTYSDVQENQSGTGNFSLDPGFTDSGNNDFSISPFSPCFNSGDPASSLDPDGTTADVGANFYDTTPGKPLITAINDVANDQGRQVQIYWDRSSFDATNSLIPISMYSIWRDDNVSRSSSIAINTDFSVLSSSIDHNSDPVYFEFGRDVLTFAGYIPAAGFIEYAAVVPTLIDSSSTGTNESNFTILAHSNVQAVHFDSDFESGYSVDNIAPIATRATFERFSYYGRLQWDAVEYGEFNGNYYPEQNGIWYKIYAGSNPDFTCDVDSYVSTTTNTQAVFPIFGTDKKFYKVIVSDKP